MSKIFKSTNGEYIVNKENTLSSENVCIAEHLYSEERCVVKILKKSQSADKELILWKKGLSHPSIIQYSYVDKIFSTTFIYMPRYKSSLQRYILDQGAWGKGLSEEAALDIFKKLCAPVKFLHDNKIAHRDITTNNFVIDEDMKIVLIDFELSYDWSITSEFVETERIANIGTPVYMAPELLSFSKYRVSRPDIWALGVCLYILRFGSFPFWNNSKKDLYCTINLFNSYASRRAPVNDVEIYKNINRVLDNLDSGHKSAQIIKSIFVDFQRRPTIDSLI